MSQPLSALLGQRAIVIGASMAGLLAARVLSERFAEVCLHERDELPDAALTRKGTPHAVHAHGLLARGREVLETLFPGFTGALVAQGGVQGDMHEEAPFSALAFIKVAHMVAPPPTLFAPAIVTRVLLGSHRARPAGGDMARA